MVQTLTITERDLKTLTQLLDPGRLPDREPVRAGDVLPRSLLADCAQALGSDRFLYSGSVMARREDVVLQVMRPDGTEPPVVDVEDYWDGYFDSPYNTYQARTGDYRSVTKLTDFATTAYFFAHDPWAHAFRDLGIRHHMDMPLPRIGEVAYDLCLSREGGSDFTERDRLLLQLLGPHFIRLHRAAQAARSSAPRLTPRQREVLTMVARGLTDGQIGRRLGMTEATVGKHLENAFSKLGVTNRVAAVAAAHVGGLEE